MKAVSADNSNFSEYLTLKAGSQQQRDGGALTYPSEVSGKIAQVREFKVNEPQGMQQSGLFKAEYVFIVDSEGEDEATSRKVEQSPPGGMGTTATRPTSLAIPSSLVSDVVRPKTRATNLQAPTHPEMPHGMASQQKHGQTKPGVIRPVPVKSKILLKKEEEAYEPNPFSKYLEDNSDLFSEQDVIVPHKPVSLHPLYQTRLYPPAKSLLHPQTLSHADCLTPGPFSHLSSFSLSDEQENSHTLFSHNVYNKVRIPC
uniref:Muscular LMNA interacting protein n=1 Tax=Myotis myotis TaxID=51298 RepID=A0A7J7WWE4_MYOMY|nr:muscular LMNA interacting protein [Myotis myotis]